MAEVDSHSNGKHSLEDNDSPVKAKLLKTENGKQTNGNSNGVNKENTVSDLVDANEEDNSTSAATAGGDSSNQAKEQSNSTSNNKYEFSEGEEDLTANTSSNDVPSRIIGEDTSESSLGVLGNSNSNGRNVKGRGIKHAEEDDDDEDDDEEDNEDDDDDDDEEGGPQGEVDDDEEDVEGVDDDDDDGDDDDDDDGGDDDDDEDDGEDGDE